MIKNSISNPEFYEILDEDTNKLYYGCTQDWYSKFWQRMSGCGPSVASNVVLYINHNRYKFEIGKSYNNKKNCLLLMDDVWNYVTPTMKGVNNTKIFYEGVLSYVKEKGLNVDYDVLNIPKDKSSRPEFSTLLNFIEISLQKDSPVAFLNLHNGEEKELDKYHWVTIISLEYEKDSSRAYVEILDEGLIKKIDLLLWYNTTTLGGGFAYFTVIKN